MGTGSPGQFPFEVPHTVAASPWLKLGSHEASSLRCTTPGLGWGHSLRLAGLPHSPSGLFTWGAWASSQHGGLRVAGFSPRMSVPRGTGIRCQAPPSLRSIPQPTQIPGGRGIDFISQWRDSICQQGEKETDYHTAAGFVLQVHLTLPEANLHCPVLCRPWQTESRSLSPRGSSELQINGSLNAPASLHCVG